MRLDGMENSEKPEPVEIQEQPHFNERPGSEFNHDEIMHNIYHSDYGERPENYDPQNINGENKEDPDKPHMEGVTPEFNQDEIMRQIYQGDYGTKNRESEAINENSPQEASISEDNDIPENDESEQDKTSENSEADNINEVEKIGGSYKDVKRYSDGDTQQVHHMPADSISPLETNDGPAIRMDTADHRKTASYGSSKDAREYREQQKGLIEQGKFRDALQMDIDDVRDKFGDKYDDAIQEVLDYVDELEKGGKI